MADTNNERVGKALELLKEGLSPFVAREMKSALCIQPGRRERLTALHHRPDAVQTTSGRVGCRRPPGPHVGNLEPESSARFSVRRSGAMSENCVGIAQSGHIKNPFQRTTPTELWTLLTGS